jgi:hypothetical protein
MLVVAVGGIVCLGFFVVDLGGRFSIFGAHSISSSGGKFFVRCRPRFAPVGFDGRSVSRRFEPLRFRVEVEVGRIIFKKIEFGSCSGGIVNVVDVILLTLAPVYRKGSSKRNSERIFEREEVLFDLLESSMCDDVAELRSSNFFFLFSSSISSEEFRFGFGDRMIRKSRISSYNKHAFFEQDEGLFF